MKAAELTALGIPESLHSLALKAVEQILGDGKQPLEVLQQVVQEPFYFFMQGGSDGTLSHVEYLEEFGNIPALSKLGMALDDLQENK